MITRTLDILEKLLFQFWWVLLFTLICYMVYEQGIKRRNQDYALLYAQMLELQQEKELALEEQEDFLMQIRSQSDPAWVELTLMKELGVVPEGQTKVFFDGR